MCCDDIVIKFIEVILMGFEVFLKKVVCVGIKMFWKCCRLVECSFDFME